MLRNKVQKPWLRSHNNEGIKVFKYWRYQYVHPKILATLCTIGYVRLRVYLCENAECDTLIYSHSWVLINSLARQLNNSSESLFLLRLPVHLVRSGSSCSYSCSRSWSWSWFRSKSRLCLVLGLGLGRVVVVVVLSLTWFLGCDSNGNFLSCCIQYLAFLILLLSLVLFLFLLLFMFLLLFVLVVFLPFPILRRLFCAIVFPSSSYMRSRKDTMSPTYVYRCIYISGVLSSYATGTDARSG